MNLHQTASEVKSKACTDCGRTMEMLHGFIYENDQPLGVYFATLYPEEHMDKKAELAIGMGKWDKESDFKNNLSVNLHINVSNTSIQMTITNRDTSSYKDSKLLGTMLDREYVLATTAIKERFLHLADHIVLNDYRINTYLMRE